jgi:hypothetical protein
MKTEQEKREYQATWMREWRKNNREKAREISRASRLRHLEERRERDRVRYRTDPSVKERHDKYRLENGDKVRQSAQAWRDNHPEQREAKAEYARAYRVENRDEICAKDTAHYQANKDTLRTARLKFGLSVKLKCVEYKGAKCIACGYDNPLALTFHHRNVADKEYEVAKKVSNSWSFDRLRPELDKCDLLCANCHIIVHSAKREFYQLADKTKGD